MATSMKAAFLALQIAKCSTNRNIIKRQFDKITCTVRCYSSKFTRVPKKVYKSEEAYNEVKDLPKHMRKGALYDAGKEYTEAVNPGANYLKKKKQSVQILDNEDDHFDESKIRVKYTTLKVNDPYFTTEIVATKNRKNKTSETRKILLEGTRLIRDAIDAGAKVDNIFISRTDELHDLALEMHSEIPVFRVQYKKMKNFSSLTTCPGIMATCTLTEGVPLEKSRRTSLPITLICDSIREPGNLGAIIRLAAGAGCDRVVLSKGCVDPYEGKVLRGGSGAHFRIPIISHVSWEYMCNYVPEESQVFVASNSNAANNSSPEVEVNSSSNEDGLPEDLDVGVENSGAYELEIDENTGEQRKTDPSFRNKKNLESYKKPNALGSALNYNEVFIDPSKPVVLVVGGETEGISTYATKLAADNYGTRLVIPLLNDVESLSVAAATGIILFEIQKHMLKTPVKAE